MGHTFQLVSKAGMKMSLYFEAICSFERPSIKPIAPTKAAMPMGAAKSWSLITLLAKDSGLMFERPGALKGNVISRNWFHLPISGPMRIPNAKNLAVRSKSYLGGFCPRGIMNNWDDCATQSAKEDNTPFATAIVRYGLVSNACW